MVRSVAVTSCKRIVCLTGWTYHLFEYKYGKLQYYDKGPNFPELVSTLVEYLPQKLILQAESLSCYSHSLNSLSYTKT